MSKSLFITYQTLSEWQLSMDHIIIAKMLHDQGVPLPDRVFTVGYFSDEIFLLAISKLFGSFICLEEDDEDEEEYRESHVYSISSPLIEEWMEFSRLNSELEEKTDHIFAPVRDAWDDHAELNVKSEPTTYGIRIKISGESGFFHPIVEEFIEMRERLQKELATIKTNRGEMNHGRDHDHFTRGHIVGQYNQAV